MKLAKKKFFICPMCGEKHKVPKTDELSIVLIKCICGASTFIQVRKGYYISSKKGIERVF